MLSRLTKAGVLGGMGTFQKRGQVLWIGGQSQLRITIVTVSFQFRLGFVITNLVNFNQDYLMHKCLAFDENQRVEMIVHMVDYGAERIEKLGTSQLGAKVKDTGAIAKI